PWPQEIAAVAAALLVLESPPPQSIKPPQQVAARAAAIMRKIFIRPPLSSAAIVQCRAVQGNCQALLRSFIEFLPRAPPEETGGASDFLRTPEIQPGSQIRWTIAV